MATPAPAPSSLLTRVAVGVSFAVHIAAVLMSLGYAGADLFEAEPEAVAVSLVTPDEVPPPSPEPAPLPVEQKSKPDFSKFDLRPPAANLQPQPQAQPEPSKSKAAKVMPLPKQQQTAAPSVPPPQAAQPAYTPPQPDISTMYQVDLGLKELPPLAAAPAGKTDFDDTAMKKADIDKSSIAAFRAHLKQCGVLPAQIEPDDKIVIVLRARFTQDAKLAAPPTLIEASASAKGPALMQAAIGALQSCQPHDTLPADKYAEWRVLDLRFTPQDFRKG